MKAAYNADKKALIDRISELEKLIQSKEQEKGEIENRLNMLEQSAA